MITMKILEEIANWDNGVVVVFPNEGCFNTYIGTSLYLINNEKLIELKDVTSFNINADGPDAVKTISITLPLMGIKVNND